MNDHEINRALRNEAPIAPAAAFAFRVMGALRRQESETEALAFPWRRMLPGLAICAALTIAVLFLGSRPSAPRSAAAALENPDMVQAAIWVPTTLLGSWLLFWWSSRLAGYRR